MLGAMTDKQTAKGLAAKLHRIAKSIDYIEKGGRNSHHKYNYVEAVDVARELRGRLLEEGVIVLPGASQVSHYSDTGGKGFLTTVLLRYRFIDIETGEELEVPWAGTGADVGGDKGLYKAFTGGLKYMLITTFLLPMSEDPEKDRLTSPEGPVEDERPAAPTIPLDRAKSIAKAAESVGYGTFGAEGKWVSMPPLEAKLAQHGVERIPDLNVDQAEDVENWLAGEEKINA